MSAYDTIDSVVLDLPKSRQHVAFVVAYDGTQHEVVLGTDKDYYWTDVRAPLDVWGNRMGFRMAPWAIINTFSAKRPEQTALRI